MYLFDVCVSTYLCVSLWKAQVFLGVTVCMSLHVHTYDKCGGVLLYKRNFVISKKISYYKNQNPSFVRDLA